MNDELNEVRRLLMSHYSGSFTIMQADLITQRKALFDLYWQCYRSLEKPISNRAGWVLSHAIQKRPELILPYLDEMLKMAHLLKSDGEKRNLVKVLSLVTISPNLQGEAMDLCFRWLNETGESIAVRAYCMDVLYNLSIDIPEIKGELAAIIENHMDRFSAGLKNKGSKILHKIYKSR